jgi:hypothetical protein
MSKRTTAKQKIEAIEGVHHAWCNQAAQPREGCKQCSFLYSTYPLRYDETPDQAMERYFPKAQNIPPKEPEPGLVMVKRGRSVIEANEQMEEAIQKLQYTRQEMEEFLREESETFRRVVVRRGHEVERIEEVRTRKSKYERRRTDYAIVRTEEGQREIKRVRTTASKLEKDGRLTREMMNYVQIFARIVAEGMGMATEDGHDSTNKLTASYDGFYMAEFRSRTLSDRQIDGTWLHQEMRKRIPREFVPLFEQVLNEEVSGYSPLARTLSELGEKLGYKHKQSSASGGTQVYFIAALIAHFLQENGIYTLKPRQSDAA